MTQLDILGAELSNEERRVVSYSGMGNGTLPKDVTPQTPLSDLYLNWTERELPERERTKHVHRLHPYLGKYIPQLVEIFLRKFFAPGQTVLDPFAGDRKSTRLNSSHTVISYAV